MAASEDSFLFSDADLSPDPVVAKAAHQQRTKSGAPDIYRDESASEAAPPVAKELNKQIKMLTTQTQALESQVALLTAQNRVIAGEKAIIQAKLSSISGTGQDSAFTTPPSVVKPIPLRPAPKSAEKLELSPPATPPREHQPPGNASNEWTPSEATKGVRTVKKQPREAPQTTPDSVVHVRPFAADISPIHGRSLAETTVQVGSPNLLPRDSHVSRELFHTTATTTAAPPPMHGTYLAPDPAPRRHTHERNTSWDADPRLDAMVATVVQRVLESLTTAPHVGAGLDDGQPGTPRHRRGRSATADGRAMERVISAEVLHQYRRQVDSQRRVQDAHGHRRSGREREGRPYASDKHVEHVARDSQIDGFISPRYHVPARQHDHSLPEPPLTDRGTAAAARHAAQLRAMEDEPPRRHDRWEEDTPRRRVRNRVTPRRARRRDEAVPVRHHQRLPVPARAQAALVDESAWSTSNELNLRAADLRMRDGEQGEVPSHRAPTVISETELCYDDEDDSDNANPKAPRPALSEIPPTPIRRAAPAENDADDEDNPAPPRQASRGSLKGRAARASSSSSSDIKSANPAAPVAGATAATNSRAHKDVDEEDDGASSSDTFTSAESQPLDRPGTTVTADRSRARGQTERSIGSTVTRLNETHSTALPKSRGNSPKTETIILEDGVGVVATPPAPRDEPREGRRAGTPKSSGAGTPKGSSATAGTPKGGTPKSTTPKASPDVVIIDGARESSRRSGKGSPAVSGHRTGSTPDTPSAVTPPAPRRTLACCGGREQ